MDRGRTGAAGTGAELHGRDGRRSVVTARGSLLALVLALAGTVVGGFVPLFGLLGRFAGLFLAAFALGLFGPRRYVEVGAAGALVSGVSVLLNAFGLVLVPVLADYGPAIVGVGAGVGLLVSLAGHYFGRDLRAGLTRSL